MPITPVDFASLLCSRLCHDLLSPVGAFSNGLELLADETDPAMRVRCMDLLNESARVSAAKLKFFRLAFGAAGGLGEQIASEEAHAAIAGLLANQKRTELAWLVEAEMLPKAATKVLLNLALLGIDALVRGGRMAIGAEDDGKTVEIVVQLEGPRIILDQELRETLTVGERAEGVSARAIGAYLVNSLAAEYGGQVRVSEPGDAVMILGATMVAG